MSEEQLATHRIYKLESRLSLMGLSPDDWFVLAGSWILWLQTWGMFTHSSRVQLLLTVFTAGATFLVWRRVKDRVPSHFLRNLIGWLSEADVYHAGADVYCLPHVVNTEAVLRVIREEELKHRAHTARAAG